MQLHAAHLNHQPRRTLSNHQAVAVSPALRPHTASALDLKQPAREVSAKSSKATSLDWDDLKHAVPRADPEKRVLQEINYRELVEKCPDWRALWKMEESLRYQYERQPNLAVTVVVRASELADFEVASDVQRRQVAKMMDSSITPFIVKKGIYSLKATTLPVLLSALAALQYRNPGLNDALLKLLESGVDTLKVQQLVGALCAGTQLGLRLSTEQLDKVAARLSYTLRHCAAEEFGSIATSLVPYKKLPPSLGQPFMMRLAETAQGMLGDMSGEQLVDLLLLFVKQDFSPSGAWVASYQRALLASLPGLTQPRAYTSLLFSLAKGSLAITEDFLEALLKRLAAPASPAAARRPSSPPLLATMKPADLAVVASVLSIYGYAPSPEWAAKYAAAVEDRAADMQAQQVVTIIDSCLELGVTLSPDLLDELLAAAEPGLAGLPAPRLLQLVAALSAAEHRPDKPWLSQLQTMLVSKAASSDGSDLAALVCVLPQLPYAYPPDGESTASVLKAVKARAGALKGLEASPRNSILQALLQLNHPAPHDFVKSLAPPAPPPPPPPPAPAPAAAPAKATAAAPAAPRTPAAPAPGRSSAVSRQPGIVSSTRAGRPQRPPSRYDEEEEDDDEDEEFDRPRSTAAARRASVPPAPSTRQSMTGVVASSRAGNRRPTPLKFDDEDEDEEVFDERRSTAAARSTPAVSLPSTRQASQGMVASSRADSRRPAPLNFDDEDDEGDDEVFNSRPSTSGSRFGPSGPSPSAARQAPAADRSRPAPLNFDDDDDDDNDMFDGPRSTGAGRFGSASSPSARQAAPGIVASSRAGRRRATSSRRDNDDEDVGDW